MRRTASTKLLALLLYAASAAYAAPETVRPTGINDKTGWVDEAGCNVTGPDVAAIDEDPDSADTEWCDTNAATNTPANADVEMGNPTDPPTSTANAQEVRVWIGDTGESADPACSVDILEGNTVRVNAIASTTITTATGMILAANWTFVKANWTDTTGASIEVGVDCTVAGGPPGTRASAELGAVELNLDTAPASARKRAIVMNHD